jgi:glucose/arabinose dehydrogenase
MDRPRRVPLGAAARTIALLLIFTAAAGGLAALCFRGAAADPRPAARGGPVIQLVTVAMGLESPVQVTHAGRRLFVVEQPGRIRLFDDAGRLLPRPYLDVRDRVTFQGECGFLGVAFHPDFARNGYFYVDYTTGRGVALRTVISAVHADPAAVSADPASERVLFEIPQPYPNHNGGQVAFGPDGMLYIGMGDGGSAGDPQNRAQDPRQLLGKILRIDVTARRDPYAVPNDNPFVADPRFRPEIFALGLRNPWRFSFDRATGDCFAGDVGQNSFEEIDVIRAGGNYGWRIREGLHPFRGNERPPVGPLIDPVAEYGRDKGQSVTGGFVYRGKKSPVLTGIYFYADYATGRFWGLRYENGKVTANAELNLTWDGKPTRNRVQPSSFGEDASGELYVCDHSRGNVYLMTAGR